MFYSAQTTNLTFVLILLFKNTVYIIAMCNSKQCVTTNTIFSVVSQYVCGRFIHLNSKSVTLLYLPIKNHEKTRQMGSNGHTQVMCVYMGQPNRFYTKMGRQATTSPHRQSNMQLQASDWKLSNHLWKTSHTLDTQFLPILKLKFA